MYFYKHIISPCYGWKKITSQLTIYNFSEIKRTQNGIKNFYALKISKHVTIM
jgi:hypothetical protein